MLTERDQSFFKSYIGYLVAGCPPQSPRLRAALPVLDAWVSEGFQPKTIPRDELAGVFAYAQSDAMNWELSSVTGEQPDFAMALAKKLNLN